MIQYLAVIYAWTGDKDEAIERLTEAVKLPGSHVTYGNLRLNPFWDPLRGDPRFEQSLLPSRRNKFCVLLKSSPIIPPQVNST